MFDARIASRRRPGEPCEELLLQLETLGRGLDDQGRLGHGCLERACQLDAVERLRAEPGALEVAPDAIVHGREHGAALVGDPDRMPCNRENLSDAVPHEPRADDRDPLPHPAV